MANNSNSLLWWDRDALHCTCWTRMQTVEYRRATDTSHQQHHIIVFIFSVQPRFISWSVFIFYRVAYNFLLGFFSFSLCRAIVMWLVWIWRLGIPGFVCIEPVHVRSFVLCALCGCVGVCVNSICPVSCVTSHLCSSRSSFLSCAFCSFTAVDTFISRFMSVTTWKEGLHSHPSPSPSARALNTKVKQTAKLNEKKKCRK